MKTAKQSESFNVREYTGEGADHVGRLAIDDSNRLALERDGTTKPVSLVEACRWLEWAETEHWDRDADSEPEGAKRFFALLATTLEGGAPRRTATARQAVVA